MLARRGKGFTLIELMIVITIIGIMAGLIGLSVATGDPAKEALKEAKRFIAVTGLALDESAFNQQDLGIHLEDEGYDFVVWEMDVLPVNQNESENPDGEQPDNQVDQSDTTKKDQETQEPTWRYITADPSLAKYEFPENIRVEIEIEDSEILELESEEETELTRTNLNLDEIGPEVEEEEIVDPPHIYILSSGEMSPSFRIGFYHVEKPDSVFYVVGDEMGRVDFEEEEFIDD